ncbi:MAG TPA: hypothetical protein VN516_08800 [Candidatus Baltobacteraceae bacterium]|nr:hypothetical protein [Candidatus Baltobacteraceae bacterium]
MKTRIATYFLFVVLLATIATGCCTHGLMKTSRMEIHDVFCPTAIYQSTNNNSFALEGTFHKQVVRPEGFLADRQAPTHSYLIIVQNDWPSASFQMNGNLWVGEIKKLSSYPLKNQMLKSKLSGDFEKIADLPKNDIGLEIKKHHPYQAMVVFLPITVATDIALSPIYLVCLPLTLYYINDGDVCLIPEDDSLKRAIATTPHSTIFAQN